MKNISFISPMYNSEAWVDRLIENIPLESAYEIIICDDCSTDNTLDKIKEWQTKIPIIKIIRNDVNMGCSYSYNRLVEEAQGEYIAIIDSDDYYLPKMKEICKLANGDYDIVWYDMIDNEDRLYDARKDGVLWSGCLKIFKKAIVGNARFGKEGSGDVDFTKEVFLNSTSDLYTETIAYKYNYPRNNSVHDRFVKGELK
jgi:glycosyltransferase involved in cell wall biosynthesis